MTEPDGRRVLVPPRPGCAASSGHRGPSFWISGSAWLDARRLADEARLERILTEPGDVDFADAAPPLNYFRLGFSSIAGGAIRDGIHRLIEGQRPGR